MSTNEKMVIREMLALSDEGLVALEDAISREKAARHECSGGTRFPELKPVVITCAPGLDTPDVRSHVAPTVLDAVQKLGGALKAASAAGKAAFERGAKAIPIHDPALMQILRENPGEMGACIPFLDAWSKAWHSANVAAPVPEVEEAQEPIEMNPYLRQPDKEDQALGKILSEKPLQAEAVFRSCAVDTRTPPKPQM